MSEPVEPVVDERSVLVDALAATGGRGAGWMARRMKLDVHEVAGTTALGLSDAAGVARRILSESGRIIQEPSWTGERLSLVGVQGMNPAVVTVQLIAAQDGTWVRVRGVALEGPVKQHSGERAAQAVLAGVTQAVPQLDLLERAHAVATRNIAQPWTLVFLKVEQTAAGIALGRHAGVGGFDALSAAPLPDGDRQLFADLLLFQDPPCRAMYLKCDRPSESSDDITFSLDVEYD